MLDLQTFNGAILTAGNSLICKQSLETLMQITTRGLKQTPETLILQPRGYTGFSLLFSEACNRKLSWPDFGTKM